MQRAEVLSSILIDYQDNRGGPGPKPSEYLQLVFGLEVKEVDPSDYTYILVPPWASPLNETLRDEQRLPKAGPPGDSPVPDCCGSQLCPWGTSGVHSAWDRSVSRSEHYIYGEPRELLTQVWVQEGYLEYRQVPDSNPASYEFLWGPGPIWRPANLKSWEYLDRSVENIPAPSTLCRGCEEEKGTLSQRSSQAPSRPTSQQLVLGAGREADLSLCD